MTDRDLLKLQLLRHEGLRLKPYTDTTGHITIGVGRNLTSKGISHPEALDLFEHDVDDAIRECAYFPWFMKLDPIRQRVLVDLMFNLGKPTLLEFVNTLKAMAERRDDDAAKGMLASKWARQVGQRALTLAGMWRTGADVVLA